MKPATTWNNLDAAQNEPPAAAQLQRGEPPGGRGRWQIRPPASSCARAGHRSGPHAVLPALVATFLFAGSVIAASRSARLLGSQTANFWRILLAALFLGLWAHTLGQGWGGGAFALFFLSGVIGFGLGDYALFEALPRLGPRLSSLMINCLAAPFAALIEWLWLDTRLSAAQMFWGVLILSGVGLSLAPERGLPIPPRQRLTGILLGLAAGFGQGLGAVITRKAFALAAAAGTPVDGGTAAYQRILGGLAFVTLPYLWHRLRRRWRQGGETDSSLPPRERRRAWAWVLANALAGPSVGVGFYQWALKTTPSGIVLPIVAMSPLVVVPFTYLFEGDRPGWRSLAGGVLAVLGVIGLALHR
jgi:drug/metabolite transporter (DMT)-like permease